MTSIEATNIVDRSKPLQGRWARENETDSSTPVNIGNAIVPASLTSGQKTLTAVEATLVASTTPCTMVQVQAKSTNTIAVLVGSTGAEQWELFAGQSLLIPIDDAVKIYAKSASAGTTYLNYIYYL